MAKDKRFKIEIEKQIAALSKMAPQKVDAELKEIGTISYPGLINHSIIKKDLIKIGILVIILFGLLIVTWQVSMRSDIITNISQPLFSFFKLR